MQPVCLALLLISVWSIVSLVAWRLFATATNSNVNSNVVPAIFSTCGVALLLSLGVVAFSVGRPGKCFQPTAKILYWPITLIAVVSLFAFDVIGLIGAVFGQYRVVTGPQYLAIAGCIMTVVGSSGLQPKKAW